MDCYIYISYIKNDLKKDLLEQLLQKFQNNNKINDITGMLLYHSGNVIQLFEGPIEKTKKLMENINKDPLHKRVIIVYHKPIKHRIFPEWNMGFITKNFDIYNRYIFKNIHISDNEISIVINSYIESMGFE